MPKDLIPVQRQQQILSHLRLHGALSVSLGAQLLSASEATIRRDFDFLCQQNVVDRTHGGVAMGTKMLEQGQIAPFTWRASLRSVEKERIARTAAALLAPGDTVYIDGGTTTLQMAEHLPSVLHVITNSLFLAGAVNNRVLASRSLVVTVAGGQLSPESGILHGPKTVETLREYHPGWAFITASGVTREMVGNNSDSETSVQKVMVQNARKKVLLVDSSKMGKQALMEVCPIREIDILITDAQAPGDYVAAFESAGVECMFV